MQKNIVKKGLVVVVIFLFVTVSFQPVFATNTFEDEKSDLVKVVVNTCNINGGKNHTKYLTKEQAQQLKDLFDIIYKKLDNCKSRDEANYIFKDAVVSINNLGLLPDDMTVEEAQKLVTGGEQNPKVMKLLEKSYNNHKTSLDDNKNALCYLVGKTTGTTFIGPIASLTNSLVPWLFIFSILVFLFPPLVLPLFFWNAFPINLGYEIGLGYHYQWMHANENIPATGQIHTIGLNGPKSWNESFWGNLSIFPIFFILTKYYYPGIFGFTGLNFYLDNYETNFNIGFALKVKIDYNQPY